MDSKFKALSESVLQIQQQDIQSAKANLQYLKTNLFHTSENSLDLQYYLFYSALSKRVIEDNFSLENIYLRNYDNTSQIDLFYLLYQHLPVVSLSHPIANDLICQTIGDRPSIVLLNIGIGKGLQEVDLLRRLAKQGIKPKQLTIIGIEPSEDNLLDAESNILKTAEELDFNVSFVPIAKLIENLTDQEWLELANYPGDLIINEAFSLHHIVNLVPEIDTRQQVICKLAQLNPVALILIEPNSDHNVLDLSSRFNNAWEHYGLVFEVIDKLAITQQEKLMLKAHFFGREIEDILGNSEDKRCERHEPIDTWLARLYSAGFKPNNLLNIPSDLSHDVVNISVNQSYISIDYEQTSLVGIICVS